MIPFGEIAVGDKFLAYGGKILFKRIPVQNLGGYGWVNAVAVNGGVAYVGDTGHRWLFNGQKVERKEVVCDPS